MMIVLRTAVDLVVALDLGGLTGSSTDAFEDSYSSSSCSCSCSCSEPELTDWVYEVLELIISLGGRLQVIELIDL
jgi:hypothetical protein